MRAGTLLALAASLSCAIAQTQTSICAASGLLGCVEAPLSTSCADVGCACSQIASQTACYTSFCPNLPIPSEVLTPYYNLCGGAPATPTPTSPGTGSVAAGQTTATSKAGANMGAVVPAGGLLAAALGVVAYL